MKSNIIRPPVPAFKPIHFELVFESQTELDAFGILFNHAPVMDALERTAGIKLPPLHEDLESAGANVNHGITKFSEYLRKTFGSTNL